MQMKKISTLSFSILILLMGLIGCNRENAIIKGTETIDDKPVELIVITFLGIVNGADGKPIKDVKVTLGGQSTFTNSEGLYYFEEIQVASTGSIAKLEKSGFKTELKLIIPNDLKVSQENFTLQFIDARFVVTTRSNSFNLKKQDLVLNYPDSALTTNNLIYTKSAKLEVMTYHLSEGKHPITLPIATNPKSNQDVEVYTMLSLRHQTDDGSALKINEQKPIEINYTGPITSPPTLFILDELKGIWRIASDATKNEKLLIKTDGYYAIGILTTKYALTGTLVDANNLPLNDKPLSLIDGEKNTLINLKTDSKGKFSTRLADGTKYTIISDNGCSLNRSLSSNTMLASNTILNPLKISESKVLKLSIASCGGGSLLPNGIPYVIDVLQNGRSYNFLHFTPNITKSVDLCDNSDFELRVNQNGKVLGEYFLSSKELTKGTISLPQLEVCNDSELGGQLIIDNAITKYTSRQFYILSEGSKDLSITDLGDLTVIIPNVTKEGTYVVSQFTSFKAPFTECKDNCYLLNANVKRYGIQGQMVEITLEGKINDKKIIANFKNIRRS